MKKDDSKRLGNILINTPFALFLLLLIVSNFKECSYDSSWLLKNEILAYLLITLTIGLTFYKPFRRIELLVWFGFVFYFSIWLLALVKFPLDNTMNFFGYPDLIYSLSELSFARGIVPNYFLFFNLLSFLFLIIFYKLNIKGLFYLQFTYFFTYCYLSNDHFFYLFTRGRLSTEIANIVFVTNGFLLLLLLNYITTIDEKKKYLLAALIYFSAFFAIIYSSLIYSFGANALSIKELFLLLKVFALYYIISSKLIYHLAFLATFYIFVVIARKEKSRVVVAAALQNNTDDDSE